jgi:hypothetical protein
VVAATIVQKIGYISRYPWEPAATGRWPLARRFFNFIERSGLGCDEAPVHRDGIMFA